jgi:acyl-CoA thioester hydrolase
VTASAEGFGVEIWRGSVNTWECDQMGHLSARFYVARAMEGLIGLAAALGMPKAFAPGAGATLLVRDQHIRFLREARAGVSLHMRGAVIEMGETDARLLQVLVHTDTGEPAATFQTVVAHVTTADARPFAWPAQAKDRAASLAAAVPAYAEARSLSLQPFDSRAGLHAADRLGLETFGTGAFGVHDCDSFGRMRSELLLGRIAEGILLLIDRLRIIAADDAGLPSTQVGGAALEYRLIHHRWPQAGDRMMLRSGLTAVDQSTVRAINWMLDPLTGDPWGTAEAVIAAFDMEARKIIPFSPDGQARVQSMITAGLTL